MAFPNENDDPLDLARVAASGDRVDSQIADRILRGLSVKAQMRQAAALERIADLLDGTTTGLCATETMFGRARP